MNSQFIIFFAVFFTVYSSVNYYIGLRGWQALGKFLPAGYGAAYWFIFLLLAVSYIAGRFGQNLLPAVVSNSLIVAGSYWLAAMHLFFFIFITIDLVGLFGRKLGWLTGDMERFRVGTGLIAVILVVCLIIYGVWNARNPRLVHYEINIAKPAGSLEKLRVVMISDIHLGRIVNNGRLMNLIEMVNAQEPDLVLLPGDIIDENIDPFVEQRMADSLLMLKPKYGTFAVFGNHEYIGGHSEEAFSHLQSAGVKVLRDSYLIVEDSFYIVGRDDRTRERFQGQRRQELSAVMDGLDLSLPVILLDHQPYDLAESQEQGVDLQLSGHTHLGQLFPFNFITKRMFEIDWGYLRKGDLHVIVSCGFGTWGPPIRLGNTPEAVSIVINFIN